ncbi:MBOAT family protein [Microbulbifer agarilyticus]|uniref:MBOAT family O-acyltransferase n=1 Tax=Microbulbifer agarilyticus TaxID=260552 RepID=UPI001C9376A1|nr:MBOAT family O-acyltransferase [Microbulbifer agarilyticus]MBY6190726.1 MBOAT family protein [Microbulbifer agarilyticus]
MLFNSIEFILVFLPIVFGGFYLLRQFHLFGFSLLWLSIASLFFYGWWSPTYLPLLLGSIAVNYLLGRIIEASAYRQFVLIAGVSANLVAIGIYKYLGFFSDVVAQLTGSATSIPALLLPLAISFFTFQQIAYLVDTYKTGKSEHDLSRYLLFVSFFPQLIAGPIVKHSEVSGQFTSLNTRSICTTKVSAGFLLFTIGLVKKVLIADQLAPYASPVFVAADQGADIAFLEAWGGLLAYTFQLYFDFSGYADMALGVAMALGIKLPKNFNSPYKATSIIEFWRRWHITLSHFLRDYLYIPLGGNRSGSRNLNLLLTMLLGGLWHGAGWNFIIWGGLHGSYLVINHQWLKLKSFLTMQLQSRKFASGIASNGMAMSVSRAGKNRTDERQGQTSYFLSALQSLPGLVLTFLAVCAAWAFFRAETFSGAIAILSGMSGINGLTLPNELVNLAPMVFSGYAESHTAAALGAFPHIKGFILIFLSMTIAMLAPNSYQIREFCFSNGDSSIPANKQAQISGWVTGGCMFIAGIALGLCLKVLAFSPSTEFLYFNF